jgi:hypothetical protein
VREAAEKDALGQGGIMRQAFCGVLQQELRDYYRLMAILEAQSQQAPPCADGGAPQSSGSGFRFRGLCEGRF